MRGAGNKEKLDMSGKEVGRRNNAVGDKLTKMKIKELPFTSVSPVFSCF